MDSGDLRSCREMLCHLNHPRLLRNNSVARCILESSRRDIAALEDDAIGAQVRQAVATLLEGVTVRQRAIVRRCYMGGERYADVARSLSISERHAFRERDAALRYILAHVTPAPPARTLVHSTMDNFWRQVAHAQAIEQNGSAEAAASALEHLSATLPDADRRCFVETRLARLYIGVDRFSLAAHHLNVARRLLARTGDGSSWRRAEVDIAEARLMDAVGDLDVADQVVRRACAELRSWSHTSTERRIPNALVDGLTLRAEKAFDAGDLGAATQLAFGACKAADDERYVDPQFAVAARDAAAMAGWSRGNDWRACEQALQSCYSMATQAGLTRQAVIEAAHLAGCLRLAGHARAAFDLLTPLVATARTVGAGEPAAILFYELVSSSLECGALEESTLHLKDLLERAMGNPLRHTLAEFVAAKLYLAQRNYALALQTAENAESALTRMGKDRFVGVSLRLQAEALAGLGQRDRAVKTVQVAIQLLTGQGQRVGLAAAYGVLGRLSGNRKYLGIARGLLAGW